MAGTAKFYISLTDTVEAGSLVAQRLAEAQRLTLRQLPKGEAAGVQAEYYNDALGIYLPAFEFDKESEVILKTFEFPFGPKNMTYEGSALAYSEIQRPSKKPLLRSVAPQNRKISLGALLADRKSRGKNSIEEALASLEQIAGEDQDLLLQYGGVIIPYRLRMTGLSITSLDKSMQGETIRARVSISLVESHPLNTEIVHLKAVLFEPEIPAETAEDDPNAFEIGDWALLGGYNHHGETIESHPMLNPATEDFAGGRREFLGPPGS
jgi:hypothetical protein